MPVHPGQKGKVNLKLLSVLLLAVTTVALASVSSPTDAARLVYGEVLNGNIEGKQVLAWPAIWNEGQAIGTWHESVAVPFDGYLVLVDDMALANWEHPCRWVFVSPAGDMEIVNMLVPPLGVDKMLTEYSDLPAHTPIGTPDLLEWFVPNPRLANDPAHTFAWIISGGADPGNNHIRYYGDVQFLNLVLTQDYGYSDANITICMSDGLNPAPDQSGGANSNPDLDGDGDSEIDFDATMAGVTSGFNQIHANVSADDQLIIFSTDHGGPGKGGLDIVPEVILNLWGTTLSDEQFHTWIDDIDAQSMHVAMEQCYSGGFLLETIPGTYPRSFTSAANGSEYSWAGNTYPQMDEWAYWWIGAQHGSVPPAGSYPGGALPSNPDVNGDTYVSMIESAAAALAWDAYAQSGQEHPQYDDSPDTCGSLYYTGGPIPSSFADGDGAGLFTGGLSVAANPIISSALFHFTLSGAGNAELVVMDLAGRTVTTLVDGQLSAGEHNVSWAADQVPAGVYIVRLSGGGAAETLRVVKF